MVRIVPLDFVIFVAAMLLVTVLGNSLRARPLLGSDQLIFIGSAALVIAIGRYAIHRGKPA
ncbi:hypothetical protein ACCC88_19620 [Sphingomonas sp. Sphisp140]|uniref:hypothetical protein n=1 Tax=unclassified Sphingomonas TaxID=196159 RepID=UPI0039AFE8C9